ncbi:MAG: hypothetical protein ACOZNI_25040 [Myxococcota bacterium]
MQIHASSLIHHPRARVYQAYRDELPKIAPYMPNIKEIVVRRREERPGGVKLHNEWIGKGEVPKVVQGIIRPDMLRWDDFADWDDAASACAWQIKLRAFTENVKCGGTNRFTEEGPGKTRVTLTGTLDIDLREIPGVPRVLAGTIAPQVEKFVIALITPNLEQVNASLGRYLDANK